MRQYTLLTLVAGMILLGHPPVHPHETLDQADALALLAKIEAKVKFDPAHPKRVIGIDV